MAKKDWKRPQNCTANDSRRRVALVVSYDGRFFCGWQSQTEEKSVQDEIKKAAIKLTSQQNIEVVGSGRTDSKVHAMGQVAHIEMDKCTIPAKAFCYGLNAFLPKGIIIKKAYDVPNSFHARYSTQAREYRYFIKENEGKDNFSDGLITNIKKFPSLELLNSYAKTLVGTHDFTTFTSSKDDCPSKVRDIYESEFFMTKSIYDEDVLCYKICGNAFLYHMVRSIVGTLIGCAQKGETVEQFKARLDSKDRRLALKTAPSDGLYLWRVSYDPNEYQWFEEKYGR